MREILFRGKREYDGQWVYGYLSKGMDSDIWDQQTVLKPCIEHERCGSIISDVVIPETVGQYTGLKDKDGERIFEGDILVCTWKTLIAVFFDDCYLQFRAREIDTFSEHYIDYYGRDRLKIVGNIFDWDWRSWQDFSNIYYGKQKGEK